MIRNRKGNTMPSGKKWGYQACKACGALFEIKRRDARFCGARCRMTMLRYRQKAGLDRNYETVKPASKPAKTKTSK